MADQIRGLLPDGTLPSAALAQVHGIVDELELPPASMQGVPIFETLADAEAYEAVNPGKIALHFVAGEVTVDPEEPVEGEPVDFTHQFLGKDVKASSWPAAKGGLSLPKVRSGTVSVEAGVATFAGDVHYGPATMPFTGEPTITAVVRTVGTKYAFLAGEPITHALTAPSGTGHYNISNSEPHGTPTPSGDWQIVTARWGKPGETQRAITVNTNTVARAHSEEPPASMSFRIGGYWDTPDYQFTGDIREVRVYDRRLTDDEVFALHEALAARYGVAL